MFFIPILILQYFVFFSKVLNSKYQFSHNYFACAPIECLVLTGRCLANIAVLCGFCWLAAVVYVCFGLFIYFLILTVFTRIFLLLLKKLLILLLLLVTLYIFVMIRFPLEVSQTVCEFCLL